MYTRQDFTLRCSRREGASYVEALVLLAFLGLGVIAGVRVLAHSVSHSSEVAGAAIARLAPVEHAESVAVPTALDHEATGLPPSAAAMPIAWNTGADESSAPAAEPAAEPEPSLAERAWNWLAAEPHRAVERGRQTQKFIGDLAKGAKEKIDEKKQAEMNANAAKADLVKDVPLLGPLAQAGKSVLNAGNGIAAGAATRAVDMVAGPLQMAANPRDTASQLPEMLEHVPVMLPGAAGPNPLKLLRAENDEERARALNPLQSLRDDWDYHTKQYERDYNNGDYAEITGSVGFDVAMALLPFAKGSKLGPSLELPELADPPAAALPKPPAEMPTPPEPAPGLRAQEAAPSAPNAPGAAESAPKTGAAAFADPKERAIAEYLEARGDEVHPNPKEHVEGEGRQGDSYVNDVKTEFKSLEPGAGPGTVKNSVNESIKRGGQAREIVIDARSSGLTEEAAKQGAAKALGISRGKLDGLRIVGDGYDFRWTPR